MSEGKTLTIHLTGEEVEMLERIRANFRQEGHDLDDLQMIKLLIHEKEERFKSMDQVMM